MTVTHNWNLFTHDFGVAANLRQLATCCRILQNISCYLIAVDIFLFIEQKPVKGAVSYRFLQGLLTLMCNNSKLKADINPFFFLLRRQTSKVYNWLQKVTIQHPVALL